jgi:hypothetical protein
LRCLWKSAADALAAADKAATAATPSNGVPFTVFFLEYLAPPCSVLPVVQISR